MNLAKRFLCVFLAILMVLPLDMLPVQAAESDEVLTIHPDVQDGKINCFQYFSYPEAEWYVNSEEAYIDLGSSNEQAQECYYEIPFAGSKIEVFAVKSYNHGKVKYSVDGGNVEIVDLYNSSRTQAQSVYQVTGLSEGEHVLKAVTLNSKTGESIVNQVSYAQVTHAPYTVTDVTLDQPRMQLESGQTQKISFTPVPYYGLTTDISFTSEDESIASVSPEGMITAEGVGNTVIHLSGKTADFDRTIEVTVTKSNSLLGGTICDTNTQYTQDRYEELSAQRVMSTELTAWKNDKAISELVLYSKGGRLKNVTVTAGNLVGSNGVIDAENVTATFIKSTLAYNQGCANGTPEGDYPPEITENNRSESSDILYQTTPIDISTDRLQPVWVEFSIPKDAAAGTYTGTLTVTADDVETPLVFTYQIRVQDVTLPDAENFKETFDIEFWQYPYSSAEYYGVEPFSEEHLAILESSMLKYKEIGGHAITTTIIEDAWDGQTYSANEVHYPSMVKWIKEADGSFSYDYTDFDKWVEFNKSLGMGDKIVMYSIVPWHNSFTYWENGSLVYEPFTIGSDRFNQIWTDFLNDLASHLEQKGWFDEAYIGIDERGLNVEILNLIDSIKDSQGNSLKTSVALNNFVQHWDFALRATDLSIAIDAVSAHTAEELENLLKEREAKGYHTTLYSCTGHRPGNFSLSKPVESYWTVVYAGKAGTGGFMRWTYDAWVENPLEDATHSRYEPGDCFLIYPDVKDAANPISKSSVRLEKMSEGLRDVNKLLLIEKENPSLSGEIQKLYDKITTTPYVNNSIYLDDDAIAKLCTEMDAFKEGVAEITDLFIEKRDGLTQNIEAVFITEGINAEMEEGDSIQLHAAVKPENAANKDVLWSSSNSDVAIVNNLGVIQAVSQGTTIITAVSAGNPSKMSSLILTVLPKKSQPEDPPTEHPDNNADGTALKNALEQAKTKNLNEYTEQSAAVYRLAMAEAEKVLANANATQNEMDAALKTLQAAERVLLKKSNAAEKPIVSSVPAVGKTYDVNGVLKYKVTKSSASNGTVTVVKLLKKNKSKVVIPATVKLDGYTFKVTAVSANAFKNCKKLKSVVIGKNVVNIGKKAFYKCTNLKSVTLKGPKAPKLGKQAFQGIRMKCRINVPKKIKKKQLTAIQTRMKKAGVGRKATYRKK